MKKITLLSLWLSLLCLPAYSQICNYLAYDYFGNAPLTPLSNASTGQGWAGLWDVQGGDTTVPGFQIDSLLPLTYGGLQTTGYYASGGNAYLTGGRGFDIDPAGPFAPFLRGDGLIGVDDSTLWISALLRKDQNNGQSVYLELHDSNIPWCNNCTGTRIGFGYYGTDSDTLGERRWSLRIGSDVYVSPDTVGILETAFIVLRIDFGSTDSLRLYVNPPSIGTSTPSPDLVMASPFDFRFQAISFYPGNDPGNGSTDEIRIAQEYACAAPDSTIATNAPPLADFTSSSWTGSAPLLVTLDGSISSDPDGTLVEYIWDFGDGSPPDTGISVAHTFTATGIIPVTLTVTDDNGAQNSVSYDLIITDASGSFSCLPSLTLEAEASCAGGDARLRVNLGMGTSFNLMNAGGGFESPTTGTEYHFLNAGIYELTIGGFAGCADTFQVYIPVDSTTCSGWTPDICSMQIGINCSDFADWQFERPMRNLFLHTREGIITYSDTCGCWDSNLESELALDTSGYPIELPYATSGGPTKARFIFSSNDGNLQVGQDYVFLYDGDGVFNLNGGAAVTSAAAGRLEFNVTAGGNIWIDIDSSYAGNYLRNFRLLRVSDEFTDLDSLPFYGEFLNKMDDFAAVRFMDWGHTNNNEIVDWAERTPTHYRTYARGEGVPYETMIDLANTADLDVWICVPHMADDNFVTQMARLFRDNLDPGHTIYLEYSNEVWNWLFSQAHYNDQNRPANLNYGRAYAEKAKHVFDIWHTEFGADRDRVKRVLGLQVTNNGLNESILAQLDQDDWDYGSPTFYFGLDHGPTGNPVLDSSSTTTDIINNSRNSWYDNLDAFKQDYLNIKVYGKGIINYEGGQHFTDFTVPPYINAMYAAQYTSGIYDLYDEVLDSIRIWGSELPMAFTLAGAQESIYGSWGHLSDIDMTSPYLGTAPKYQALLDNMPPPGGCIITQDKDPIEELISDMKVYPNPSSSGYLTIEVSEGALSIAVHDINGRLIKTDPAGSNKTNLNLSDQPNGLYLIKVHTSKGNYLTRKVLKQ